MRHGNAAGVRHGNAAGERHGNQSIHSPGICGEHGSVVPGLTGDAAPRTGDQSRDAPGLGGIASTIHTIIPTSIFERLHVEHGHTVPGETAGAQSEAKASDVKEWPQSSIVFGPSQSRMPRGPFSSLSMAQKALDSHSHPFLQGAHPEWDVTPFPGPHVPHATNPSPLFKQTLPPNSGPSGSTSDFVWGMTEGANPRLRAIPISPDVATQLSQGPCRPVRVTPTEAHQSNPNSNSTFTPIGSTAQIQGHQAGSRLVENPDTFSNMVPTQPTQFQLQPGPRLADPPHVDPFSWAPDFTSGTSAEFGGPLGAGPQEAWVRPIQVQQPGMASLVPMVQPMGTLYGPVAAAVVKNLVQPEFRGDNFHDFAIKFPLYVQQISIGQALSDDLKLQLLSPCLNQGAQLELQRRQELGERVRFQDFWNWLAQKYGGGDVQASFREELRSLRAQNDGKLTLAAWREFESRFRLVFSRIESPSEEEAQALVLQQLPEMIRRGIIREQARRGQDNPTVRLRGIPGFTTDHVSRLVQSVIGQGEPVGVTQQKDSFLLKLFSRKAMELLMAKNGSFLGSGHQVKLTPHETKLGLDEVFRQAEEELRCQEKSDNLGRGWGGRGSSSTPDSRRDFDISAVSEVKAHDSRPPLPPSAPMPSRLAPEPTPIRPPSFDSRYDSRASRPQGGKGQGARARTPSPGPGPGRNNQDRPQSPRKGSGGKGWGGKGSSWTNPPAANGKGGKGQDTGKGGASPRRSDSQPRSSPSRERPCYCCGADDHWARDCPIKWCQNCQGDGHVSRDCPKPPAADRGRGAPRSRDATPPRQGSS